VIPGSSWRWASTPGGGGGDARVPIDARLLLVLAGWSVYLLLRAEAARPGHGNRAEAEVFTVERTRSWSSRWSRPRVTARCSAGRRRVRITDRSTSRPTTPRSAASCPTSPRSRSRRRRREGADLAQYGCQTAVRWASRRRRRRRVAPAARRQDATGGERTPRCPAARASSSCRRFSKPRSTRGPSPARQDHPSFDRAKVDSLEIVGRTAARLRQGRQRLAPDEPVDARADQGQVEGAVGSCRRSR